MKHKGTAIKPVKAQRAWSLVTKSNGRRGLTFPPSLSREEISGCVSSWNRLERVEIRPVRRKKK